jgi:hypothetical protein
MSFVFMTGVQVRAREILRNPSGQFNRRKTSKDAGCGRAQIR